MIISAFLMGCEEVEVDLDLLNLGFGTEVRKPDLIQAGR